MSLERTADGTLELLGHTPLVRLQRVAGQGAEVWAKLETHNPSASVKDRPAFAMIEEAEREGKLQSGATVVEATSGNTGISLAMLSAVKGYRCVLVLPEDMTSGRHLILRSYGAELLVTPAQQGMRGAVDEAERFLQRTPGSFMPRQFVNPANPRAHERTTAEEIWNATDGKVNAFVAGVGTGGTITGVARVLKRRNKEARIVAVEPKASAVLSGGNPGLHSIQGLGAGFVPPVLDRSLLDEVIAVSDLEADEMTKRLAREEGLLVGPSSGANVFAAVQVAARMRADQRIVTVLCDTGERYLC